MAGLDLAGEYDAGGTLQMRYVHGPGLDEPVAAYTGAATELANRNYHMPDERGSIVALVAADGLDAAITTYDEYGIHGGAAPGRLGYTGQVWIDARAPSLQGAHLLTPSRTTSPR